MTKRIFNSISAVAISVVIIAAILLVGLLYGYFSDEQMNRLTEETQMVTQGVVLMGRNYLESLESADNRITWIARDGTVLFDSHYDSGAMENHLEREEIKEAMSEGIGQSKRYSDTLTEQYLYCAQRLEDGSVIRLAVSQSTSFALLWQIIQPMCVVIVLAAAVSLLLATRLSKQIITPLNSLNLDSPLENSSYEEIFPLLKRIDSQQKEIRLSTYELQKKKDELDTIVCSMNEGIVLLKANGYVVTINNTAKRLLEITGRAIDKSFVSICRNLDIQLALEKVWQGKDEEKVIDLRGGRYRMSASPVFSGESIAGAALLLFDVTEKEKSEQLRREFTANVSHELKSPLHTIAGYSELIMSGIAKGEDVINFSRKIHSEAKRMSQIIQDIISLSQLDEGGENMVFRPVDLYSLAVLTANNLREAAISAQVSIEVSGQSALVSGVPQLMQSIVYNLCDNAVKYNVPGGYVKIDIAQNDTEVFISFEDSGIGIAAEHQEHIFERFYRVEKSRSREKGGSGLGLSIVKHAVKIQNGNIELSSSQGKGTKITVTFPKYIAIV